MNLNNRLTAFIVVLIGKAVIAQYREYTCSRFAEQHNVMRYVHEDLCSLLAATSQYSVFIDQEMQLTGCHNSNEMRNAKCAETQSSKVPTRVNLLLFPILRSLHQNKRRRLGCLSAVLAIK